MNCQRPLVHGARVWYPRAYSSITTSASIKHHRHVLQCRSHGLGTMGQNFLLNMMTSQSHGFMFMVCVGNRSPSKVVLAVNIAREEGLQHRPCSTTSAEASGAGLVGLPNQSHAPMQRQTAAPWQCSFLDGLISWTSWTMYPYFYQDNWGFHSCHKISIL